MLLLNLVHTVRMARTSPTVKRRRIAAELRRLRRDTGMTAEEAAHEVGVSKSAVSRIEKAESTPQVGTAERFFRTYGVAEEDIPPLLDIVRQARKRGWWQRWNDVLPEWFDTYIGLESEASHVAGYEPQLIPGILQTSDYARAVIRAGHPNATETEVEKRVDLRMQRQNRDTPLAAWLVVDEACLRRVVRNPDVMRAQLKRLLDASEEPHNDIQVLPFAAGEHGSIGSPFSILSFPDDRDAPCVYLETQAGSLYLEDAAEIDRYQTVLRHLQATAAGIRQSREMISAAIRDF